MLPNLSLYADILMVAATAGAGLYCLILSRRLSRLTSFDKGIGGAIAVLSAQVDEMKSALAQARTGTDAACRQLEDQVRQAREISSELELMIAACHDFAEEAMVVQGAAPVPPVDPPQAAVPPVAEPPSASPSDRVGEMDQTPIFESRRAAVAQAGLLRQGQG